jgi:glycerate kinase
MSVGPADGGPPGGGQHGGEPARSGRRGLRVLVAPDSYKGTLTSVEVARALAGGWLTARPDDEIHLAPLADGGEGTLVAIEAAGGYHWRESPALDPIGRPIRAHWLQSADGATAIVELAAASGLSRLGPDERAPFAATTFGTGQLVRAALEAGARTIVLGIGGSATSDGAAGLLSALCGAAAPPELGPGSDSLANVPLDLAHLDPRLRAASIRVACDVTNPLLGRHGAAATYGPQKGASPADVAHLDLRLERWADRLAAWAGHDERETPGAGAAGGVGFGLLSIRDQLAGFSLEPGVELVMDAVGFAARLVESDVVLTGEGRIDAQTAFGKTAMGVARRAADAGVPCIAVGGGVEPGGIEALATVGAIVVPVTEQPMTLAEALAAGDAPLHRCGERVARLVSVGLTKS